MKLNDNQFMHICLCLLHIDDDDTMLTFMHRLTISAKVREFMCIYASEIVRGRESECTIAFLYIKHKTVVS